MDKTILLAHGSGGKLSHALIEKYLLPGLENPILKTMDDSAVLDLAGQLAFTTDSFVVSPLFFPGGDIGRLAVCGTVNDLSMVGAKPLYLSLALIIEEGLALDDLEKIIHSIQAAARESGTQVVTGDTKVVNRGCADKLFINTAGLGVVAPGTHVSGANARPGDRVILSGSIGDHGIAVMAQRQGLRLKVTVESDCAPLNSLVMEMLEDPSAVHSLRDPTRGGLATTLNELARQSAVGIKVYEEKIPLRDSVASACALLGLDPLYVANEGKLIAIVAPEKAEEILARMRKTRYAESAAIIGEVRSENPGRVVMQTRLGTSRIVDMLSGELLPRIC
jgi:hydrogenase expression/formation protein HypE